MNGAAYLQLQGWLQFTPVLATFPGLLATLFLFLLTIGSYNFLAQNSWFNATVTGAIITLISLIVAYQTVDVITPSVEELFPFWTYISVGYVILSLFLIEVFQWVYFPR